MVELFILLLVFVEDAAEAMERCCDFCYNLFFTSCGLLSRLTASLEFASTLPLLLTLLLALPVRTGRALGLVATVLLRPGEAFFLMSDILCVSMFFPALTVCRTPCTVLFLDRNVYRCLSTSVRWAGFSSCSTR